MSLLAVSDLTFGYKKDLPPVFHDISFSIEKGQVFCVVGPNGCGKSTLIDTVLGINKPWGGSIMVGAKDLRNLKPRQFAEHVAYVPQSHVKSFPYRVIDVVVMGRTYAQRMFSSPSEEELDRARDALAQVGWAAGSEERLYTELSGGELQLVLIARALAQASELLVMDEPTAHLDFRHELNVMEVVVKLAREKKLSILMATHFLNQAFYLENAGVDIRVALMDGGVFHRIGPPSATLNEENLRRVFQIVTLVEDSNVDGQVRKYILPLKNEGSGVS
ncbi:MAG: ABC transporter ATP-binding protein [Coriobacteriia bacterium]|nr:ABC transporter ATP-binding protein [Coriobacteriia bacterium]